jgi:YbbR domain-containing protein
MKGLDRASVAALWRRLQPLRDRERWRIALTRDLGLKLISLSVAFALWAFVNASERDTEQPLQVPLELRDIPVALMVTSPRVDFVDVRVSGPRTLLSRIDRKRLSIALDLAGVRPGPAVFSITGDSLNLPRGVNVLRITPAQITLDLEPIERKTVPVRLQTTGKVGSGFRVAEKSVSPETVEVIGPAPAVKEIKAVETERLDLAEATAGLLEREVALSKISDYVSFSAQRVGVRVQVVEIESQREFRGVKVSVRGTGHATSVQPGAINLTVRGPQSVVQSLEMGDNQVYIDASDMAPGTYQRTPTVELPPGLEVVKREPAITRLRLTKKR